MRDIEINKDDSYVVEVSLPRDLTASSVHLLVGPDKTNAGQAIVSGATSGTVKFYLGNFDFPIGPNKIYWKVTYENGGVEVLPPDGDTLFVYP